MVKNPIYTYFSPFFVAYIVAYIGLLNPRKLPVIFSGDYSYGIYLYAYPIQQAITMLLPGMRIWYINFLITVPIVGLFAAFSWHCIEKRALRLKRFFYKPPVAAAYDWQTAAPGDVAGKEAVISVPGSPA